MREQSSTPAEGPSYRALLFDRKLLPLWVVSFVFAFALRGAAQLRRAFRLSKKYHAGGMVLRPV